MADKVPVKGGYDGSSLTGLAEFASGDTLGIAHGGTGIATIGSNQLITGNGTSAVTSESNLTFDGTILKATGDLCATVKVVAPALCIGSEYVLPTSDGSAGQLICTDGSGALAFADAASSGHTIADEGTALASRTCLNFVGSAVTATDNSGSNATDVTVCATNALLKVREADGTQCCITLSSAAVGESLVSDTSPQLGGNLDVNGNSIVSASNGNIPITPNGSGIAIIDGICHPTADGSAGQVLCTNGSAALQWATVNTDLCSDTSPQLGGNLDVNGNSIISASNGNIPITPNGSGIVILDGICHPTADGSAGQVLCTNGSAALQWATVSAGVTLAGSTDNTIATVTGSNALCGEANLTFDGTTLTVGGVAALTSSQLTFADDGLVLWGSSNTANMRGKDGADGYLRFDTQATERMRLSASGQLLIGTDSSLGVSSGTGNGLQLAGDDTFANFAIHSHRENQYPGVFTMAHSRNATVGCYTILQDGDALGYIAFAGDDGTDVNSLGAEIWAEVDGTPGSNDMPGRLIFRTTADGAATTTERMRIDSSGRVGIGTTSPCSLLNMNMGPSDGFTWRYGKDGSTCNKYCWGLHGMGTSVLHFGPTICNYYGFHLDSSGNTTLYGAQAFASITGCSCNSCVAGQLTFANGNADWWKPQGAIYGCVESKDSCGRVVIYASENNAVTTIGFVHLRGLCLLGCFCTPYCLCASTCIGSPTKNFEIEHPLASDESPNKYNMMHLVHSTLEGPEYGVYYRGSSQLDSGAVKVDLPEYFEALAEKTDATVQLTPVGGISNLTIKLDNENVFSNNSFCVCTDEAGNQTQCFHWIVNGRRIDKHILCTIAQGDRPGACDDGRLCAERWEYRGEMENINGLESMTCAELDDFIHFNNTWDKDDPDFVTGYENVSKANKIIMIGNAFDAIQNTAEGGKTDFPEE